MTIKERSRRMESSLPSCPNAATTDLTCAPGEFRLRHPPKRFANRPVFRFPWASKSYLMRTDGADMRRITSVGKFAGSSSTQMSADPICKVQQLRLLQDLLVQLLPGGRNKTGCTSRCGRPGAKLGESVTTSRLEVFHASTSQKGAFRYEVCGEETKGRAD